MTPFPRKQFKALMATILNLTAPYVTWRGDAEPAYLQPPSPFIWASLRIGSDSRNAVGWDELRNTDNGDGSFSTLQIGRRQIALSLDLFSYSSTEDTDPQDLLDTLHSRAWQPSNLAILNAMGLVFETSGTIVPLPTYINSRYISAAHMDLAVALAATDQATNPGGNGWINEVTSTGTYTTEGGGTATQTSDVKASKDPRT